MEHFFEKYDIVKIKQGIIDLESGAELGGWLGRIVEFLEDDEGDLVAYVRWDSVTLRNIPDDFFEYCRKNQVSGVDILIGVDALAPAYARDTIDEANWERTRILAKYFWPQIENYTENTLTALEAHKKDGGSVLQAWEEYLKTNLTFPLTAEIKLQGKTIRQKKCKCIVQDLNGSEDTYGVAVFVEINGSFFVLPLTSIQVARNSEVYLALETYRFWFNNQ
ncbi:MAG: hypothetical protein IT308_06145 [Anaerolineaceae bacterium]|nr:hypothetical protein [Anaerolineaceae bacterium]